MIDLFFDNLENPASGNWIATTITGSNHWDYPDPWVDRFPFATSGIQSFHGTPRDVASDSAIAMTRSVTIPAGGARLQFNHSYEFDTMAVLPVTVNSLDGGVVEYSTDGGARWIDGGGLMGSGATYGGVLGTALPHRSGPGAVSARTPRLRQQ